MLDFKATVRSRKSSALIVAFIFSFWQDRLMHVGPEKGAYAFLNKSKKGGSALWLCMEPIEGVFF